MLDIPDFINLLLVLNFLELLKADIPIIHIDNFFGNSQIVKMFLILFEHIEYLSVVILVMLDKGD
jgi:hypothetical protein